MESITILFGTVTGNAEDCANRLGKILNKANVSNRVLDMEDYQHTELPNENFVIVVSSTTGNGDPPHNAQALYTHLSDDKPDLSKTSFAVLALGNSNYPNFAQCGKDFDSLMGERGSTRVIDRIDCDGDFETPLQDFQKKLFDHLEANSDSYPDFDPERLVEETRQKQFDQEASMEYETPKRRSRVRSVLSRIKNKMLGR